MRQTNQAIITDRRFRRDQSGATAVEFAFLAPVLIFMLMGITGYGGYFWMSHSVQQLANDAARAAIPGSTAAERATLAKAAVAASAGDAELVPAKLSTEVIDRDGRLTVAVSYDAAQSFAFAVRGVTPMPSDQIRRRASVQLGGY
ncbi:TadE/TadG family type IV pilus assembly protein [Caulobacter rhizosphaerae]|jgi:Flp pilus assembly protein TadG|uniref:TadE/TadG family type IV pilus assembly protein n=1 Tax=Caulobacter rhizosphaerae TaxID=2010972 RepID=UPI0013D36235|nr:TadE/TadG family type IV pilus assembly protein [Caulobacter rhizosphaerae]GGL42938.1 TadE family protein [Caulobacter rhizosphaerae]